VSLLAPLALLTLAVPVAIYAIHWLFGTRIRQVVPALFLWRDLPHAPAGRRRRRVPPFTWLLALQLIVAIAGVAALARPAVPGPSPRHVALILDASATMQATDVAPSRFEAARHALSDRLAALQADDLVTLIRAGTDAELIATGSPAAVAPAVDAIHPGTTASAIANALELASARIAGTPERTGMIVMFTDAAWAPPEGIGQLVAPVEIVPTGGGSNNQALTTVVVRMDPTGRGQVAFVEIANESDQPSHVPLQIIADGAPIDSRQVDIAARTRAHMSIPLPADAHHISVQLASHDALPLDDRLDVLAPGGPTRQVEVLGQISDGLRRAMESIPSLQVRTTDASVPADLTVLARVLPAKLPPGPLLLVDPPETSARLLGVGLGTAARVEVNDPLLVGVDLAALQDETPSVSGVPGWAHVALGTPQGPLLMHGILEGHPAVSLTFDPEVSGLEKSLAFPLLISNASAWLLSQSDPAPLSAPFDVTESDIRPRPLPTFDSAPSATVERSSVDVWPWLAACALGLLGAEWLVFARRG
jgi:VWA domain-containing protein